MHAIMKVRLSLYSPCIEYVCRSGSLAPFCYKLEQYVEVSSASYHGSIIPGGGGGRDTSANWIGSCMGPRVNVDAVVKRQSSAPAVN
jgi:hypothetical protein